MSVAHSTFWLFVESKLNRDLSLLTRRDTNMFWKSDSPFEVREESESARFSALLESSLHQDDGEDIESVVAAMIRTIRVLCFP